MDKEYNIALSPTPKYGDLKVVSNPIDATITLNGKETGTTPKTFYDLLVGEYSIELTKKAMPQFLKLQTLQKTKPKK